VIIHTEDLTKYYGCKLGNDRICLSVPEGHIFGFLGPNGAGKSTLVKMLVGLIHPTSGAGEVLGRPLGDTSARKRMGFLPETFRYQGWLTPAELLAYHGRLLGMEASQIGPATIDVMTQVGLADELRTKIRNFSKGMQQRLGIACAMLSGPELLFLDEPTSALDPLGRRHVRELLLGLKAKGTTIFLNSHLLSEVELVCDSVAVIDRARIVASGSLSELLTGPCEVEVFLAEPFRPAEETLAGVRGTLLESAPERLVIGLPDAEAIPALVAALVHEGTRILGVERRKRNLETLFIETVSEEQHG